jgi:hypothetical protein
MGSPARRPINPITRCRDQPHYGYAGTDDGRGTDPNSIDASRLTLMSGRPVAVVAVAITARHEASTLGAHWQPSANGIRATAYFRTQSLAPAGTLAVPSIWPLKTLSRKSCVT